MEDFRRTYQRLCKEAGAEPQESVLTQLQEARAAAAGTKLDLRGQSLTAESCSVLGAALQKDALFTELVLSDCMLSEEGEWRRPPRHPQARYFVRKSCRYETICSD